MPTVGDGYSNRLLVHAYLPLFLIRVVSDAGLATGDKPCRDFGHHRVKANDVQRVSIRRLDRVISVPPIHSVYHDTVMSTSAALLSSSYAI